MSRTLLFVFDLKKILIFANISCVDKVQHYLLNETKGTVFHRLLFYLCKNLLLLQLQITKYNHGHPDPRVIFQNRTAIIFMTFRNDSFRTRKKFFFFAK